MRIDNSANNCPNFCMAVKSYGGKNGKKFLTVISGETKLIEPPPESKYLFIMPASIVYAAQNMSLRAKKIFVGHLSKIEKSITSLKAKDVSVQFGVKMQDTKIVSINKPRIGFDSEVLDVIQLK